MDGNEMKELQKNVCMERRLIIIHIWLDGANVNDFVIARNVRISQDTTGVGHSSLSASRYALHVTCYRILLSLDIVDIHAHRHSSHLQLPRSLERWIADEQLIANFSALLVLAKTK